VSNPAPIHPKGQRCTGLAPYRNNEAVKAVAKGITAYFKVMPLETAQKPIV